MREILFRGKRKDNGEWVWGFLIIRKIWSATIYIIRAEDNGFDIYSEYEVIPETVGEYIGLTDKNGKKIFEGDIVVCRQWIGGNIVDYAIENGYVEMKHGAFGLHRKQGYYRPFKDWFDGYEYEVIGNIHDNPDLLEGR